MAAALGIKDIIHFLDRSNQLTPEAKNDKAISIEMERYKRVLEASLPANMTALALAIRLGEAYNDPTWVKNMVRKVYEARETFDSFDLLDLDPIFQKFLSLAVISIN